MSVKTLLAGDVGPVRAWADGPTDIDKRTAVAALLGLHGLALVVIGLQEFGVPIPDQLRAPVVVLALTFVPGGLAVLFVYADGSLGARHVTYAFGISLLSVMAIGFVVNVTLPLVGHDAPMAVVPLAAAMTVFDVTLAALVLRMRRDGTVTIPASLFLSHDGDDGAFEWMASVPSLVVSRISPVPLALLLLPLLSIVGVELLNRTGNAFLLVVVLVAVALVPLLIVTKRVPTRWHSFGMWMMALAVLYHKAIWKFSGYSGQPYAIRTWRARQWTPGVVRSDLLSAELLPNGVLYPIYARLSGVHILTQYNVINPFFVSFIPLALFLTFRRYTDSYRAFLAASVFVFAHPFFRQYPTAGRAATPVLFLALFGLAISDRDSPRVVASALGLAFVLGIVVSHYGTSYYVVAAFGVTLVLLAALRWFDALAGVDIRGVIDDSVTPRLVATRSRTRITLSLVVFYSVSSLTWYMYMNGGRKFDLLPKHARESYIQLLGGSTFSGRTAARIQKNYGTLSIQLSKYVYLVIGLLIAIGLLIVLYRRLSNEDIEFDDHYFALAAAMMGIFGMTIMVRNWGGGRPLMITYVTTVIFAVVGIGAIESHILNRDREALQVFGILLLVLFVLNSGVAATLLFGGFAPSNVPNQNGLAETDSPRAQTMIYKETDIAAHVWMIDHHEGIEVYGDTFANRQTDWYRPQLITGASRAWTDIEPIAGKPLGLSELAAPGVEPGYVFLVGHNWALDGVWTNQYGPPATTLDELELPQRSKVYTTGESTVYYHNGSAESQR
ncbi:DUF2206 domain-containing protein [Halococcus saccharolyticus]|uniref:Glycosyltransferase RgtA/B/C/D-like domain-containing protein n=1 Tax=Halococcus saccharolyticus DSM 5350 TaxID=1227455 RepID=M0MHI7_9EURY|nr:DUF2206 domain-containing protein [Halococcus saccharolyticus]EMA44808.1 hypothetical protein C449_09124 [Halococcus saccharolyticus DSM 5350]